MKTTIYLIRHGQTEWNVERRMQGASDSPLTAKGIRMTENLAASFASAAFSKPDVVYCSPLGRTVHTAKILFGEQELRLEERLREINLGEWEGRLQADLDVEESEQHTYFWKNPDRFQVAGEDADETGGLADSAEAGSAIPVAGPASTPPATGPASPMPATTYSGENFYDISERSVACLLDLAAKHGGETIALVSHTTIIRAMLFHIEQRPISDFWLPPAVYPASISEISFENGAFSIENFADISHYDPEDQPTGAY